MGWATRFVVLLVLRAKFRFLPEQRRKALGFDFNEGILPDLCQSMLSLIPGVQFRSYLISPSQKGSANIITAISFSKTVSPNLLTLVESLASGTADKQTDCLLQLTSYKVETLSKPLKPRNHSWYKKIDSR